MNIIKPGYEIITEKDPLKKIERIARVCYKSEDRIDDGTDRKMIKMLTNRGHTAMLEHASLSFEICLTLFVQLNTFCQMLETIAVHKNEHTLKRQYLKFTTLHDAKGNNLRYIITGNIRAWYQTINRIIEHYKWTNEIVLNAIDDATHGVFDFKSKITCETEQDGWMRLLTDNEIMQLSYQERMAHEQLSVLFTVDRGITHELVRMREASFAQESSRYCNYGNNKFGNEIAVILPCFFDTGMGTGSNSTVYESWKQSCETAERTYIHLINDFGAKPEQARSVLPTSTKSEIVVTAYLDEWKHIFNLRACDATGPAHPQMKEVMIPLFKEIKSMDKYKGLFDNMHEAE